MTKAGKAAEFAAWLAKVETAAKTHAAKIGHPHDPAAFADPEAWRSLFDAGLAPEEAIAEELGNCVADMG